MSSQTADWTRPHFRAKGEPALLFFVAYGPVPASFALPLDAYRCTEIPNGAEVVKYDSSAHSQTVSRFRSGYSWERLAVDDPALAKLVEIQDECLVLRAELGDGPNLNGLRNAIGFLTHLLDAGCVGIYDPQVLRWWSPRTWKEEVFSPGILTLPSQVATLSSEDEKNPGTEWFHTRGMRKFGRADLSIHSVKPHLREAVIELCSRFIEYQALGGVIAEGEEIRMRSLPNGMRCFHRGHYDDLDFNNVHVEIEWANA